MESREERLARLALEDQKDALRAEIDQIEKRPTASWRRWTGNRRPSKRPTRSG